MARPFQPSPRRGEGVHTWQSQIWCRLQSKQLCTMQGQRSFVLHESTQEWCSVTLSGKTAKRHQLTEEQQWPVSTLSRRSSKQLRLLIQEKRPLLKAAQTPPISLFSWRMCNILARMPKKIFYKVHVRLLELCFCNALYIMFTSYMHSEATYTTCGNNGHLFTVLLILAVGVFLLALPHYLHICLPLRLLTMGCKDEFHWSQQ